MFSHDFTCNKYPIQKKKNYSKANVTSCDKYIIQPERIVDKNNIDYDEDYPYVGRFLPKNDINLVRYKDVGSQFVFLHLNVKNPETLSLSNDSAQLSSFRMNAYDSDDPGKCFS